MWSLLIMAVTTSCVKEDMPEAWSLGPCEYLPDFSVTTLDGEVVTTSSFEGKTGYIVFFSTECGDCRRALPRLEEIYQRLKRSDPEGNESEFICISRAEGIETVRDYWRDNGLTMPVAAEKDRRVYDLFATEGIPRLYVTKGKIITEVYVEKMP
ncbi:MAG: TlpA family protein disulfide reductase [Muribaculaceae bacterium]|nr:TlpA family protein disulfide reductase [Muribaculaceae bacterium]